MLTAEGCARRRRDLWDRLPAHVRWVIISDPQHLAYFANFVASPFVFNSQEASALLLLEREAAILVADNGQGPFAAAAHVTEQVSPVWYRCVEAAPHRRALIAQAACARLGSVRPEEIAWEASSCPAALRGNLTGTGGAGPLNVETMIREMRRSKGPDELALIRRSLAAIDAGHAAGRTRIRPGMTELDAYLLVQQAALTTLGTQAIVYGDFASGPRAIEGGGPPTSRTIAAGDLVILDFSVICHGYRGDTANAFVCQGQPTPQQRGLYEACLEAMSAGERTLRAGTAAREVFQAVRGSLAARQLDQYFTHHAGHGVGLGHPEPPYLVPESPETLQAGDVLTLEPGLYVPGVGGVRYERNYLITPTGYEVLSGHELRI